MENENVGTGTDSGIGKMFSDYKKSHEKKGGYTSNQGGFTKYFMPTEVKEIFRLLPRKKMENGKLRDVVETAFFHSVQINQAGGKKKWKKLFCAAHNNPRTPKLDSLGKAMTDKEGKPILVKEKCSLCEKSDAMLATQDQSLKGIKRENYTPDQKKTQESNNLIFKEAKKWEAKKFYIVRGIDKGQPKDGVKFWRFKHNFKKQGILDKIIPALDMFYSDKKVDFADVNNGTDLIITVVDNEIPGANRTFRDVSSIMPRGSSILHDDPIIIQQWLDDNISWRDVFKPAKTRVLNSYDYLERVGRGVDPFWDDSDSDNKRWIYPDPRDADLQTKANTRDENLDADTSDTYEVASDVVTSSYISDVDINTITKEEVGNYTESVEVAEPKVIVTEDTVETPVETEDIPEAPVGTPEVPADEDKEDYTDLPF